MSNDIMKLPDGVLAGTKYFGEFINFDEGKWVHRDKSPMLNTTKLVVLATTEKLQRWKDGTIDDEIPAKPGEDLPDIDVLNAGIPSDQWEVGVDGKPRPPWSHARLVFLIDPPTVDRFTYSSATIGARIAINDLAERVAWMSKFRGNAVHAVVDLASRPMKTKFGMRSRPHFQVVSWVISSGGTPTPLVIEPPKGPSGTPGITEVIPPTIDEELNDQLPW
jgi:hypothetical protein